VSLLWRRQAGVALFPDRLVLARASGGFRRRLEHREIVELAPAQAGMPPWQPAVDALVTKVAAGEFAKAEVTLVLSNSFVRYALIPWSEALGGREEELAFTRHCFARVYGSEVETWALKLSPAGPGQARLACAIEQKLVDALNICMSALASGYRSLQPNLMASFNRSRARLGESPVWLVVAEPGLLCLALLQGGRWQSVRTLKVGPDWIAELPGVLAREECLIDNPAECDQVLVFAPDTAEALAPRAGKWRIEKLMPRLLPGMAAGADAPYSVALGV
jgi:hypothetical protein